MTTQTVTIGKWYTAKTKSGKTMRGMANELPIPLGAFNHCAGMFLLGNLYCHTDTARPIKFSVSNRRINSICDFVTSDMRKNQDARKSSLYF